MNSEQNSKNTEYFEVRQKKALENYQKDIKYPNRYVFVLTNKCNLRCSFCFQEKDNLPGAFKLEDWISVLNQLPENSWVTLTGGEPIVFKGFKEIFLKVTDKHRCNMISNGIRLSEEIIDMLISRNNFKTLSISVDNIGNTVRDVKALQWEHAENMMRLFSKKKSLAGRNDLVLDTKTVVLDENASDLFNIHQYCIEDLKADTHSFQFLKGAPIQFSDHFHPFEESRKSVKAYKYNNWDIIKEQLYKVKEYNVKNSVKGFLHPKFDDLLNLDPINDDYLDRLNIEDHKPELFKKCMAPWESVHINNDGNLFPCMAISMGNFKENSLEEILHGNTFQKFRDMIRSCGTVEGCNRCGYLKPSDSEDTISR
jgi:MoaA/NifB/PqqE/SkfB family radical SAM enzyme